MTAEQKELQESNSPEDCSTCCSEEAGMRGSHSSTGTSRALPGPPQLPQAGASSGMQSMKRIQLLQSSSCSPADGFSAPRPPAGLLPCSRCSMPQALKHLRGKCWVGMEELEGIKMVIRERNHAGGTQSWLMGGQQCREPCLSLPCCQPRGCTGWQSQWVTSSPSMMR